LDRDIRKSSYPSSCGTRADHHCPQIKSEQIHLHWESNSRSNWSVPLLSRSAFYQWNVNNSIIFLAVLIISNFSLTCSQTLLWHQSRLVSLCSIDIYSCNLQRSIFYIKILFIWSYSEYLTLPWHFYSYILEFLNISWPNHYLAASFSISISDLFSHAWWGPSDYNHRVS